MRQIYPYYIATYVNGGILTKIFGDTKFKTYNECINKLSKKHRPYEQVAILEYTNTFVCRIITLFTDGNEVNISNPIIRS